ncbi:MAG: histone deacetylase family protein [Candidatus Hodarchaeales archaeon]
MKIVFHEDFILKSGYETDPAADMGRIACIERVLRPHFEFIEAVPARIESILYNHTERHVESIKRYDLTHHMALLAAGGAIIASECAFEQAAFALIRPPGHHASSNSCWGFCFYNNIAIAIKKMLAENTITSALIVDFDLHFGDGTSNAFHNDPRVTYYHGNGSSAVNYLHNMQEFLENSESVDMLAVSAGFDQGIEDWGKLLSRDDYTKIGSMLKEFSITKSKDRRFAVLEGGYNHNVLGHNVKAFLDGFS